METLSFQAETGRLLSLVIHSLYTTREIFLRELISNASDALDRLHFEALSRSELLEDGKELEIRLEVDPVARTLTVYDNGIGMTRQDVIDHIGTIARSGTKELMERLAEGGGAGSLDLIGRFGVGFYSCFMVADRVTLVTRRAADAGGTRWESNGEVSYTLADAADARRGTAVTLHLKPADADSGIEDYTDPWILARIVKRYSDFVAYPIVYDGPDDAATREPTDAPGPRVLNSRRPIWTRPEHEVQPAEYTEFYKHIAHAWDEPLMRMSFKAEGRWEYSALLFVPSEAAYDLYYHATPFGLQLFAQRVLIVENCRELLPRYLRFLKGVVDATDLPLHISRDHLQDAQHLAQIRKWITRKVLDHLTRLAERSQDAYLAFWRQFGRVLKEGVSEDYENKDALVRLLRFESSADPSALVSLPEYVGRMPADQSDIYYITGESRAIVERSPHLEEFRARGYEVLYLIDPVDELVVQALSQYEGRRVRSVAKGKVELGDAHERARAQQELDEQAKSLGPLMQFLTGHLEQTVRTVRLSRRLTTSPACLSGEEFDPSPQLERLLLKGKGAGPAQRRILELNPRHAIVQGMREHLQQHGDDQVLRAAADLLLGAALLSEGSELANPVRFIACLGDVMRHALEHEPALAA